MLVPGHDDHWGWPAVLHDERDGVAFMEHDLSVIGHQSEVLHGSLGGDVVRGVEGMHARMRSMRVRLLTLHAPSPRASRTCLLVTCGSLDTGPPDRHTTLSSIDCGHSPPSLKHRETRMSQPLVGIIMGSQSDWPTMKHAADVLDELGVAYEKRIVSAHRTPDRLIEYAKTARERGLRCIIAGAGGAAHLPGMVASMTIVPVLGVPVKSRVLSGVDSLLSIVQMPGGVPVGTLAIGRSGSKNAAILAASIIATTDDAVAERVQAYRDAQTASIAEEPVDVE